MVASRGVEPEIVDELEDHLRQKLDELSEADLSNDDAFTLASIRLGHPGCLCLEFEKLHGSSVRLKQIGYMIGGYLMIDALLKLVEFASNSATGLSLFATDKVEILWGAYTATGILLLVVLGLAILRMARAESSLMNINIFNRSNVTLRRYPTYAVLTALVVYLVLTLLNGVGFNLALVHHLPTRAVGEFYFYIFFYEAATTLTVPLVLIGILAWIVRVHSNVINQIPQ